MNTLLNINKPRLYMALYQRPKTDEVDSVKYHTTLLLVPKGASSISDKRDTFRYHADNGGGTEWFFKAEQVRAKTYSLQALVLLGKISIKESELRVILEKIPMGTGGWWRCRHWVWAAMIVSNLPEHLVGRPRRN